jgi:hypothetical protein
MYFCFTEKCTLCSLVEGSPKCLRKQAHRCIEFSKKMHRPSAHDVLIELGQMLCDEASAIENWWIIETRFLFATTLLALAVASIIAVNAKDNLSVVSHNTQFAPLQRQHYYPTTGVKPKIGRAEDLLAPRIAPEPADTYRRKF